MSVNPWDTVSSSFNTHHQDPSQISPGAADNILIAWPALLEGVARAQPHPEGLKALDFGCGTGGFCVELRSRGYESVGCDRSEQMLSVARENLGKRIPFYLADQSNLNEIPNKPFDLVSAIMVFQFIKDIAGTFKVISALLKPNGVLAFAVFNPEYVKSNCGIDMPFQDFANKEELTEGCFCPEPDLKIPVYIRDEKNYDSLLETIGFRRIAAYRPPFTQEFLSLYPMSGANTDCSEYIVMVYQKG